MLLFWE